MTNQSAPFPSIETTTPVARPAGKRKSLAEFIVLLEEVWGNKPEYQYGREMQHVVYADTPDDAARVVHTAYLLTADREATLRVVGVMRLQPESPRKVEVPKPPPTPSYPPPGIDPAWFQTPGLIPPFRVTCDR